MEVLTIDVFGVLPESKFFTAILIPLFFHTLWIHSKFSLIFFFWSVPSSKVETLSSEEIMCVVTLHSFFSLRFYSRIFLVSPMHVSTFRPWPKFRNEKKLNTLIFASFTLQGKYLHLSYSFGVFFFTLVSLASRMDYNELPIKSV